MRIAIQALLVCLCVFARSVSAQNIAGNWYGTIDTPNGEGRRYLVISSEAGGKPTCIFDVYGDSSPAKCEMSGSQINIVTRVNNVVRLTVSGDQLVGTFTFTSEQRTYPIKMGRTPFLTVSQCQQTIPYAIVSPPTDVPPEFRVFSGVWVGTWRDLCGVLIVEEVKPDGTVTTIYAIGSNGINRTSRRRWTGVIANGKLSLRDSAGAFVDYKAINANELSGTYNNAAGTFRRQ